MTTALVTHPVFNRHLVPEGHPECPQRLARILDALHAAGVFDLLAHIEAPAAARQALLRVHTDDYLYRLASLVPETGFAHFDADTVMSPDTLHAAEHAAGAAVAATDAVLSGEVRNAFCCVRPPGHHAGRDYAMGFCFLNNAAVAAAQALASGGIERVAILDFDVHHGNGTEDIFRDDERVLLCSAFQHPFYPGTGGDNVPGRIVNVPLPAGSDGEALLRALDTRWGPAIDAYRPGFLVLSAGFDAHDADPLAGLRLNDNDYLRITAWILERARQHAGGRIVSCLEGGYALDTLGGAVTAHVRTLAGL